jgi:hypothetical protein
VPGKQDGGHIRQPLPEGASITADDLDPGHSLVAGPAIARMRETAAMPGRDIICIAVKLPGG